MDVATDLTPLLGSSIVRLDAMAIKHLQEPRLYSAIDELALLSAKAMQLRKPLTSCEKLVNTDNILYLIWEKDEENGVSKLIGMLKVGRKQLFLYDREMKPYEGEFLALLDFYVHFSRQRQGYGKKLFEFMLQYERMAAHDVAFDNPSVILLAFMSKHYGLTDAVWQNTNFVVFPQLFTTTAVDGAFERCIWLVIFHYTVIFTQSYSDKSFHKHG
ncbi:unnamed protein product [Anisakis simplex]|uniref:Alpha-tubulin N-acetyltransferase n=1 Tax=Anisakis simplex TaxID=6269 RepID=A0A0M3K5Q6_ANISI|nr:unnamed protein product [Anisakis simplex]